MQETNSALQEDIERARGCAYLEIQATEQTASRAAVAVTVTVYALVGFACELHARPRCSYCYRRHAYW